MTSARYKRLRASLRTLVDVQLEVIRARSRAAATTLLAQLLVLAAILVMIAVLIS